MSDPTIVQSTATVNVYGTYINYNNVLSVQADDKKQTIIFTMVGNVIITVSTAPHNEQPSYILSHYIFGTNRAILPVTGPAF